MLLSAIVKNRKTFGLNIHAGQLSQALLKAYPSRGRVPDASVIYHVPPHWMLFISSDNVSFFWLPSRLGCRMR